MLREIMDRRMEGRGGQGRKRMGVLEKLYDGESYDSMEKRTEYR